MKKLFGSLLFIFACIIPTSVLASDIKGNMEILPLVHDEKLEKRAQEINDYFVKLEELKIQLEVSSSKLDSAVSNGISTFNALSNYETALQQYNDYESNSIDIVGLEKLESEAPSIVQPFSVADNAEVTAPTVYYDNDSSAYVASSGWKWKITNNDTNNSGYDAFSIHTDREITVQQPVYVNTWDERGNKANQSTLNISSSLKPAGYGYTAEFYDYSNGKGYSAYRGTSWMFFRFTNGTPQGKTLNFQGTYAHTWSGGSITDVSLSGTSLEFEFSNSSRGWQRSKFNAISF